MTNGSAASKQAPALGLILVTALLDMMAMGIVMPVLPVMIEQLTGSASSGAIWTGIIAGIWAVMQFFCGPLLGAISDSFGRRPVILLSAAGLTLSWVMMALAPTLGWLIAARIIGGITSASGPAIFAYVADVVPPERRTRAFGLVGAAISAGFVVGPAVGGILGDRDPALPFWFAAACTAVAFAWGWLVLPESVPAGRRTAFSWRTANPAGALWLLRSSAELARLATSNFLLSFAHRLYTSIFVLYAAHRYGMDMTGVGILLAMSGGLDLLIQGALAGRMAQRIGDRTTMVIGLLGGAAGLVGMAFATSTETFVLALVVNAIWGISEPTMRSLMSSRVAEGEQGQLQGALHCIMSIAGMTGPVFFGWVYGLSLDVMPGLCFLIAAVAVVAAAAVGARSRQARRSTAA